MSKEEENGKTTTEGKGIYDSSSMPEGVIAKIISLTTPPDACRFLPVSRVFHAAAESDIVWNEFLPSDWKHLISRRKQRKLKFDLDSSSKKEIFFSLCFNPVLIDDGNKSFYIERWGGKKCIMLGARDLSIVWGDAAYYWSWEWHPCSRFKEVAVLLSVWWFEIRGTLSCRMLSPKTTYVVYFVFTVRSGDYYGFNIDPVYATVGILGMENHTRSICLDPYLDNPERQHRRRHWMLRLQSEAVSRLERPQKRHDGWFEIELGEFESGDGDAQVEMALMEVKGSSDKTGLLIEGIDIRPKPNHSVV